jgi:invasion protein IalB
MRNYAAKRAFLGIGRFRAPIRGVFTLLAVAIGACALASGAYAQGTVKSKHQDWEVRCDKVTGSATEQCVVMQYILAEDRPGVGLTVILLKTADKGARLLRVLAPLGVFLPSGLGLKIDDADVGRSGFVRCVQQGCLAEVILDDKLLNQLKNGKQALFVVFQTPEEGIGIPVSLAGLAQGFDALP